MTKRTPDSIVAKIVAARELGATTGSIAMQHGMTPQGVRNILRRETGSIHLPARQPGRDDLQLLLSGVVKSPRARSAQRTPETIEHAVVDHYQAGASTAWIGQRYGRSPQGIRDIIRRVCGTLQRAPSQVCK